VAGYFREEVDEMITLKRIFTVVWFVVLVLVIFLNVKMVLE